VEIHGQQGCKDFIVVGTSVWRRMIESHDGVAPIADADEA
jgi:hypothetical protein